MSNKKEEHEDGEEDDGNEAKLYVIAFFPNAIHSSRPPPTDTFLLLIDRISLTKI